LTELKCDKILVLIRFSIWIQNKTEEFLPLPD